VSSPPEAPRMRRLAQKADTQPRQINSENGCPSQPPAMPRQARKRARADPSRARPRARALRDDAQNANPTNSSRCPKLNPAIGFLHRDDGVAELYAGARALLVWHWSVSSDGATRLTTSTFDLIKSNPGIGRAEGLRRAM
jgi:hypothetical protein